jgi:exonuclease VII small subunit
MAARHRELTPLQQAKDCFRQARKELRKIVVYPTQSDRPAIVAQVQQMLDQAEQHLRDVVAQAKAEEAEAVKHLKALPARLRALLCKLRAENIDPATMAELKALVRLRRRR